MSGRADSAASFVARCHGQQPSISVSSEKLRKVRISTIAASSPTLSNVKGARDTYDLEPFGELIDQGVYLLSRHASPLVFLRRLVEIVWSYVAKQIGNYAASRRLCLTTLPEFRMDVYGLASTMTVA